MEPTLRNMEIERVKRRRPNSLDAYDLVLRASPHALSHIAEDAAIAIPLSTKRWNWHRITAVRMRHWPYVTIRVSAAPACDRKIRALRFVMRARLLLVVLTTRRPWASLDSLFRWMRTIT